MLSELKRALFPPRLLRHALVDCPPYGDDRDHEKTLAEYLVSEYDDDDHIYDGEHFADYFNDDFTQKFYALDVFRAPHITLTHLYRLPSSAERCPSFAIGREVQPGRSNRDLVQCPSTRMA